MEDIPDHSAEIDRDHRKYLWKLRFSTGVHFLAGVLGEDRGGCPQASLLSDA
jgi:hypothetical protein